MADDAGCAIQLAGVEKTYVMGEVEVPVLRGIDLELRRGEITVILGPSGSGKSTLLNLVGGIDRPSRGQVLFGGRDLAGANERELTEYRRRHVGFVFQFYNLVPTLTARENVEVATEIADNPMDAAAALELVDMGDRLDFFPAQMSGGQQQRVSIARAVAKRPDLLLCDEPTGALDAATGVMVLDTLVKLNQELGTTLVVITHAAPIAGLAHRVVRIGDGRASASDNPARLTSAKELRW